MIWPFLRLQRFVDFDRVTRAIEQAERRTSGEIRVSVAPFFWGSVQRAAERAFARLGMTRTRAHNGVLIFIVPTRRSFVVLGDSGVHERVGQKLWEDVVGVMTPHFRRGAFTDGVVTGIQTVAEELAREFPYDPATDVQELPDAVDVARAP
jgi:uncharacterized membrane protein